MSTKDKLIASAQKNLEKGQIQKAIKDYQDLLKLEPKVDQHRQKLADLMSRAGMASEAIGHYEVLATGYADKGFYLKAIAVYKQVQKLDATKTDVYLHLAELNKKQGLTGNAMAEYRSLLEFYEKKNQRFDAAGVLQKMVELEPENLNLHIRVIQFLLKEKMYDKAVESVAGGVEIFKKSASPDKITKILDIALPKLTEDKDRLLGLAQTLTQKNASNEAILVLNVLIKAAPDDASLLEKLADGYCNIGDVTNERLTLAHLVKVAGTPDYCERLIRLCLASGEAQRALHEIEVHKDVLLQAGRKAVVVEILQQLSGRLPENSKIKSALQSLGAVAAAVTPQPASSASTSNAPPVPKPPQPVSSDLKAFEPVAAVTSKPAPSVPPTSVTNPSVDMAEEISLDFLEGFVTATPTEERPAVPGVVLDNTVTEISVEGVLDVDVTLAVEIEESHVALPNEIELDLTSLKLDSLEDMLDDSAVAIEEESVVEMSASPVAFDGLVELPALAEREPEQPPALLDRSDFQESSIPEESEIVEEDLEIIEEDELEIVEDDLEIIEDELEIIEDEPECVAITTNTVEHDEELLDIQNHRVVKQIDLQDELHELEDLSIDALPDYQSHEKPLVAEEICVAPPPLEADARRAGASEKTDCVEFAGGAVETSAAEATAGYLSPQRESDTEDAVLRPQDIALQYATDSFQSEASETATEPLSLFHAELEEIEFYLKQGLLDQAENVCRQILTIEPEHPIATEKLQQIEHVKSSSTATSPGDDADFFDLASELLDDGAFQATAGLPNVVDDDRFRFDSVFSEFKKGIESQIDNEDAEAHYNLGIAYKEMGLIDDAIGEFEKSMHDPVRLADCLTLIGICNAEKGAFDQAESVFLAALQRDDLSETGKMGICYELGLIYEIWDKPQDALNCFEKVSNFDIFFRNVGEKVDALRTTGLTTSVSTTVEAAPATPSAKNRVSFV